jgi:hypothetical protein
MPRAISLRDLGFEFDGDVLDEIPPVRFTQRIPTRPTDENPKVGGKRAPRKGEDRRQARRDREAARMGHMGK